MTERNKQAEPEGKALAGSPEDKGERGQRSETIAERVNRENRERADKRQAEGREGEGDEPEYGPDGTFHVMESEMESAALDKEPGAENAPPDKPSVIHVMELQMKGEAVGEYIQSNPHRDNTLPTPEEPPLPGKPPEPPLGGSRVGADKTEEARRNQAELARQNKPTQYPTEPDRRSPNGKRR
jgi:hypothetical protein